MRRSRIVLWLVLLVAVAAGGGLYVWSERELSAGPEPIPESRVRKSVRRPAFDVPDKQILPASLDWRAEEVAAERILFLPFLDRTPHEIHPAYLRAYDKTLAAFADAFLEAEPVAPELAARLAEGNDWHEAAPGGEPAASKLEEMGGKAGAGLVVWGELFEGGRIELHSMGLVSGAGAEAWDGAETSVSGAPGEALYEGPAALLAAMLAEGRFSSVATRGDSLVTRRDSRVLEEWEQAWEELLLGRPHRMVRAERALARLAYENPFWPTGWASVAFARALRRSLFGPDWTEPFVYEGPNPARHLAALFDDLGARERGWIAWVDLSWGRGEATFQELRASAVASGDPLLQTLVQRERMGSLSSVAEGSSPVEEILHARVTAPREDAPPRRLTMITSRDELRRELDENPYLLRILRDIADLQGDWSGQISHRFLLSSHAALMTLEALRGGCFVASGIAEGCEEALASFVAHYDPGHRLPQDWLRDDEAFEKALGVVKGHLESGRLTPRDEEELPQPNERLDEDAGFASRWLLASRLVDTANAAMGAAERASAGRVPAWRLVAAPPRRLSLQGIEIVVDAAARPMMIGGFRGQREEAMPYLRDTWPFYEQFRSALHARASVYKSTSQEIGAYLDYEKRVEEDPYDRLMTQEWARWQDWRNHHGEEGFSAENAVRRLDSLVPRSARIAHTLAWSLIRAHRNEEAWSVLDEAFERHPSAGLLLQRDDLLYESGVSARSRLERLAAGRKVLPSDPALESRVAHLHLDLGEHEAARAILTDLREARGEHYFSACEGLARIESREESVDAALDVYEECARYATNQWTSATLYNRIGRIHRDHGRFREALEWHQKARGRIGGGGTVLVQLGHTHALLDEAGAARKYLEQGVRQYPKARLTRNSMGYFLLRIGETDQARRHFVFGAEFDEAKDAYRGLWFVHRKMDDVERFQSTCRRRGSPGAILQLATSLRMDSNDPRRALEELEAVTRRQPRWSSIYARLGQIHLDLGELDEARGRFEEALFHTPNHVGAKAGLVRCDLGQGDLEAARERLEKLIAVHHPDIDVALARYHLLVAEGRQRRALRVLREEIEHYEVGPIPWDWMRDPWSDRAFLLLLYGDGVLEGDDKDALRWVDDRAAEILLRVPWLSDTWDLRARVAERLGDAAAAESHHAEAARWNPAGYGSSGS